MANMGALTVNVNAETAGFRKNMNKAAANVKSNSAKMNRALGKLERSLHKVRRAAARTAKGFFSLKGAVGLLAGSAGIGLIVKKSIDAGDSIAKVSKAIGISTDALQEYRFAADIAGVATETFDKSVSKFTKNMGELSKTSSELDLTLRDLAPALLEDLRAAEATEVGLQKALKALDGINDAARRAAVAQALFGRSGIAMVNMAKDAEELRRQARDLDLVIRNDLILAAEVTKDKFTVLGHVIKSNVTRAVLENADAIGDLAQAFSGAIPHMIEATAKFSAWLGVIDRTDKMLLEKLTGDFEALNEQIDALAKTGFQNASFFNKLLAERLDLMNQIAAVEMALAIKEGSKTDAGTAPPDGGGIQRGKSPQVIEAEKRTEAIEAISKALVRERDELNHNIDTYGRSVTEVARLNAERQVSIALKRQGITLTRGENRLLGVTIDEIVRLTEKTSERDRIQNEQMERDKKRIQDVAEKVRKEAEATAQLFDQTIGRSIETITDEFSKMAAEGEFNFKRLGNAIAETMRQIVTEISAAIIKAEILKAIGLSDGGGGGGGFFSSLGRLFGFGSGGTGGGTGDPFPVATLKRGGVVGKGGPVKRISPLAFVGAPRFAEGGEVPAILHRGERVLTEQQNREFEAGGPGGAVVINQTFQFSGDVTATTQREVLRLMPTIRKASVAAVVEANARDRKLLRRFA